MEDKTDYLSNGRENPIRSSFETIPTHFTFQPSSSPPSLPSLPPLSAKAVRVLKSEKVFTHQKWVVSGACRGFISLHQYERDGCKCAAGVLGGFLS